MHQPVIGAINGAAIGGGFCLAIATDIRVASDRAYFRAAGISNGLTASELGLSYLLPRAVGSSRAAELMLTGRDLPAGEAAAIGLVSEVVSPEHLLGRCLDMATRIIGFSRSTGSPKSRLKIDWPRTSSARRPQRSSAVEFHVTSCCCTSSSLSFSSVDFKLSYCVSPWLLISTISFF